MSLQDPLQRSLIDNACRAILRVEETQRGETLCKTAYHLGRGLAANHVHVDAAIKELHDTAVKLGMDPVQALTTIQDALQSGREDHRAATQPQPQEPAHKSESEEGEEDAPRVLGKLPEMPLDVYPPAIEEAVKIIAASKGVSPDMVGAFFLSLGSACIGRARSIRYSNTWSEAGNLYVLVMAGSGGGKSHTQKFVFKTLAHMEAVQKARYQEERRKYEEDMILFRKSKAGRPPKKGEAQCPADKNEMPKRPPNMALPGFPWVATLTS